MNTDINNENPTISKDYISQLFDFDQESVSRRKCIEHTGMERSKPGAAGRRGAGKKKKRGSSAGEAKNDVPLDTITVSELLDLYSNYLIGEARLTLNDKNFNEYKRYLSKRSIVQNINRVFFQILDVPVYKLNNYNIHQYSVCYQHTKGLSNSTINRCVTNLRGMLTWGYKMGILKERRLAGYENLPDDSIKNRGVRRYLNEQEVSRLIKALNEREKQRRGMRERYNKHLVQHGKQPIAGHPAKGEGYTDYVYPMVLLSLMTGARKGSVRGLKWRDIDFENNEIVFQAESSKTARTTVVPMTERLASIMSIWKEQNDIGDLQKDGERYVFARRDGHTPLDPSSPRCWKKILEAAKIENFRWHDLRHTFATLLVQRGVDIETLKSLMGHTNINTTAIYLHSSTKHMHNSIKMLNNLIRA